MTKPKVYYCKDAVCRHCLEPFVAKRRTPGEHWPEHCSLACARATLSGGNMLAVEKRAPIRLRAVMPRKEAFKLIR